MNFWLKQIIKAVAIWILLMMAYFTLNLWFNVNIPIISNVLGVNLVTNTNAGRLIVMTSIFPNWTISLLCFIIAYVSANWLLKANNKTN